MRCFLVIYFVECENRIHRAQIVYDGFRLFGIIFIQDRDGNIDRSLFLGHEDDEQGHDDDDRCHDVHGGIYEAPFAEDL